MVVLPENDQIDLCQLVQTKTDSSVISSEMETNTFVLLSIVTLCLSVSKELYELKSYKLCNNDRRKSFIHDPQCTKTALKNTTVCDRGLPLTGKYCTGMMITMDKFHGDNFWSVLSTIAKEDYNSNIRQVVISTYNVRRSNLNTIGSLIDRFLTPNLWWQVEYETYDWRFHDKNVEESVTHQIVLEWYNHVFEPHLRHLSSIQYPDFDTCNSAPMLLGVHACTHPGWGSVLYFYHKTHRQMPYAVSATHASISNNLLDNTSFITGSDCPNTMNKWNCAFLSMTNCTIPKDISKCHEFQCIQRMKSTMDFSILHTNATTHGMPVWERKSELFKSLENVSQHPLNIRQSELSTHQHPPPFTYKLPHNKSNLHWVEKYHVDSSCALYNHRFLLRRNYFYRSRIAQTIQQFYVKNNITPKTRCVAAQIRRGDRVIYGVNMTELCLNASRPITVDNPINHCLNFRHELVDCESVRYDKGCGSGVPFGAVTLASIINNAEQLVSPIVRTLFVFTDDENWLKEQRLALLDTHPTWYVVGLEAPKEGSDSSKPGNNNNINAKPYWDDINQYAGYHYMRSRGGTASGTYFHASLDLAQQCEAFIGHFASETATLFYQSMCYQHGSGRSTSLSDAKSSSVGGGSNVVMQGVCPPVYDLRQGL